MSFKLAEGEHIVKSYDYAHAFLAGKGTVDCNLTITNKRIVRSTEGKTYLHRVETQIGELKSVTGTYKRNRSLWARIRLILGIPLCIVIIGIPIVKQALKELRACYLDLDFVFYNKYPDTFGETGFGLGAVGAGDALGKKGFFARLFHKKSEDKVYVDKAIAKDILDEITAVMMDNKITNNVPVIPVSKPLVTE